MKRSRWPIAVVGLLACLLLALPATPALADGCTFQNGFKALHAAIPAIVGDCLADEHSPGPGQTQQETTQGMLRWQAYIDPALQNYTFFDDGAAVYWFGSEAQCFRPPTPIGTRYYLTGVCRAPMMSAPPPGATALCVDTTASFSDQRAGTCSGHGGVAMWLSQPAPAAAHAPAQPAPDALTIAKCQVAAADTQGVADPLARMSASSTFDDCIRHPSFYGNSSFAFGN